MPSKLALARGLVYLAGLVSLMYAVVTAPGNGKDLSAFQLAARDWLTRVYQFGAGPAPLYPPFTLPIFSPLALFSFRHAVVMMLALNLIATAFVVYLAIRLWGARWPAASVMFLAAFLLSWAPFRVTIRLGQISLAIVVLLLGGLLARQKKRPVIAGLLLGIALCKYSLTLPFFLYFIWKREWKIVAAAIVLMAVLTQVFAWHLGMSAVEATARYIESVSAQYAVGVHDFTGTTEIKLLILSLTGGNIALTTLLNIIVSVAGLACLAVVVTRRPKCEALHFSALASFALWSAYHRTYDSVLCIIPAAALMDFDLRGKFVRFSRFWLAALGLFIISVPGLLTERFKLSETDLSRNPAGWFGLHVERLLVFGLFWSLLWLAWRQGSCLVVPPSGGEPSDPAEPGGGMHDHEPD